VTVEMLLLVLSPLVVAVGAIDLIRSRRKARELRRSLGKRREELAQVMRVHEESMSILRRALQNLEQERSDSRKLLESTVNFIGRVLEHRDPSRRAAGIVEGATRLLEAKEVSFYVPTRDGRDLVLRHISGLGYEEVSDVRVRVGEGRVGTAAARGTIMQEKDFEREGVPPESGLLPDARSCVPLLGWAGLYGVVGVGSTSVGRMDERLTVISGFGGLTLETAALLHRAEEETQIDATTRLVNRANALRALDREIDHARRYGRTLSVSLFGIDGYPQVEGEPDTARGAAQLRAVGKLLAESARDTDLPARLDEETFIVLLPESGRSDAVEMADRIRKEFEESTSSGEIPVMFGQGTMSGGIATFPEDGDDAVVLVQRATDALVRARKEGGNRVISSPSPDEAGGQSS